MAEYGAHLTSANTADNERPTFFEVLAQESLMSTLRPALKHIIRILAETNPQRLGWMFRYTEELYTIVDLVLQHHFLRTTSASFAENFYGMKRVPANASKTFDPTAGLPYNEHIRSLLLLVVIPYLKLQLDAVFERWQQQFWDRPRSQDAPKQRMQRIFLTIYPFLHMTWEGVILSYQLKYLFHKSDCHSPFLHVSGVQLKYLSRDDIVQQTQATQVHSFQTNGWRHELLCYLQRGVGILALSISHGLSMGVFFLQFLEWWYMSESYQTQIAVTALPIPDAPKKYDELLVDNDLNVSDANICPICGKARTNDTVLATSGWRHELLCYLQRGVGILALSISHGLSMGVFFLQFLQWWYMSESYQTQIAVTALPIPDPPKKYDELLVDNDLNVSDTNICPICGKARTNDTVLATSGWRHELLCYLQRGVGILALSISHGLSMGVFFLQFLEWWYMSESYQTQIAVTALPIPDPPKKYDELLVDNELNVSDANICPICGKARTNDTVLATSGYVFCYPCIFNHVKSHMCCPITRYPSESSHLVKLYPPDV